mmetsp:Transcript_15882/g.37526  ORF Transcript_15882/g.37526 Transcript_15882/m.37526 type:complete len:378 (+) Transcript_15882:51-1184(+)
MALLRLSDPGGQGIEIGSGVVIGRKEGCQVCIPGPTVSAVQCEIRWSKDEELFEIIDKSSNGTFLNGQLFQKAVLQHGDLIQLTRRWPQNLSLQFKFVLSRGLPKQTNSVAGATSMTELKVPDHVKEAAEPSIGKDFWPRAMPVEQLQKDLLKVQEQAQAVKMQLSLLQKQLSDVAEHPVDPSAGAGPGCEELRMREEALQHLCHEQQAAQEDANEVASKKKKLQEEVEEALKDAAKKEGIRCAHQEMIQECLGKEAGLQSSLQALLVARQDIRQSIAKYQKKAEETRTVEVSVQKVVEERTLDMKNLQRQLQNSMFDINAHSISLSQNIKEEAESLKVSKTTCRTKGSKRPPPRNERLEESPACKKGPPPTMQILE